MAKIFNLQDLKSDKIRFLKVEWEGMSFLIKRGTAEEIKELSKNAPNEAEDITGENIDKNIELMRKVVFNNLYTTDLKRLFNNIDEVDEIPFSFIRKVFEVYSEQ